MDKVIGHLTVLLEEPFWVGIFDRIETGRLSVAKVTFGAEPKENSERNKEAVVEYEDRNKVSTGS